MVGVEYNENGVLEFFKENEIKYVKEGNTFTSVGLTPPIVIHCRDLFDTVSEFDTNQPEGKLSNFFIF